MAAAFRKGAAQLKAPRTLWPTHSKPCLVAASAAGVVVVWVVAAEYLRDSNGSNQEGVPDLPMFHSTVLVLMASMAMIMVVKRHSTQDSTDTFGAETHPLPMIQI